MTKYKYKGPVTLFGRCIAESWKAETSAPTFKKAMSNFKYQYKQYAKITGNIELPGVVSILDQTEVYNGDNKTKLAQV